MCKINADNEILYNKSSGKSYKARTCQSINEFDKAYDDW